MIIPGEELRNASILFRKFANLGTNSLMNARINSFYSIVRKVRRVGADELAGTGGGNGERASGGWSAGCFASLLGVIT